MVLADAAEGVLHMHSLGLAHKDFKEANILVVREASEDGGGVEHVRFRGKVGDFGLSRPLRQSPAAARRRARCPARTCPAALPHTSLRPGALPVFLLAADQRSPFEKLPGSPPLCKLRCVMAEPNLARARRGTSLYTHPCTAVRAFTCASRDDCFAVGVVLYNLLSARPLHALLAEQAPLLLEGCAGLSEEELYEPISAALAAGVMRVPALQLRGGISAPAQVLGLVADIFDASRWDTRAEVRMPDIMAVLGPLRAEVLRAPPPQALRPHAPPTPASSRGTVSTVVFSDTESELDPGSARSISGSVCAGEGAASMGPDEPATSSIYADEDPASMDPEEAASESSQLALLPSELW